MSDSLSKREKQVFLHLMEDARLSDQDIARRIQTSRPTVSRIRQRLEKQGYIKGYMPRVDFERLGLKVRSIILYRWKDFSKKEELQKVDSFVKRSMCVSTAAKGEGFNGRTNVVLSAHRTLEDHSAFVDSLREIWADNVDGVEVFLTAPQNSIKYTEYTDMIKDILSAYGLENEKQKR